ncbi:hypothetical protein CTAYLR_003010 [Chrysophaeum taylorii]|uniref:C3H1-type domain-containing protein n=1 Tax=Chrysophaeum taylorii TaxID=2483200 RepID=A0AAD7XHA8_9STRA|nr:hypothetical protein CTAYLR_003010 [Chrysophaeum taylorii]
MAEMADFATFLDSGAAAALYGSQSELPDMGSLSLGPLTYQPRAFRCFENGGSPIGGRSPKSPKRSSPASHRLVRDLHEWLCRRPEHARHIGTTASDDGGATFSEFYSEFPQHAAKRKCKGSGIKAVVEAHGAGLLEWVDAGSCGMGRIQVAPGSSSSRRPRCVLVTGFPRRAADAEVVDFFESRGARVESLARLQVGRARVALVDAPSLEAALALDGQSYRDHYLSVVESVVVSEAPAPAADLMSRARAHRPALTVTTTLDLDARPAVAYAKLCKYAATDKCPYGERCRYAHSPAELEAARLRRRDNIISPISAASPTTIVHSPRSTSLAEAHRERQLAQVLEDAGLEDKWLPHLSAHELDRDALVLCDESDLEKIGLALGARVKLRRWIETERRNKHLRFEVSEVITPPPPDNGGWSPPAF